MSSRIVPMILFGVIGVGGIGGYLYFKSTQAPAEKKPATAAAAAPNTSKAPAPENSKAPAPNATKAPAAPAANQEFDRKAANTTAEPRRPPRKEDVADVKPEAEGEFRELRKGRMLGAAREVPDGTPPLPEYYPFDAVRRTFPDANSMTVDLAIKNSSGVHWKTAYVILRSSRFPEAQQFEINEWQIDEVVGLDYTFPRSEQQNRLTDLRVISVTGDKRDSALAEMISQSRRKWLEVAARSGNNTKRSREGDQLYAPGLLSVIGRVQKPVTGISVSLSQQRSAAEQVLKIKIAKEALLQRDMLIDIKETSDERLKIAKLALDFKNTGIKVEDSIAEFVHALGQAPFKEAIEGEAKTKLEALRVQIGEFNDRGAELAGIAERNSDAEVRKALNLINAYSTQLVTQIEAVETQIHKVDPYFFIQQD